MRRKCIEGALANLPALKESEIVTKSYEFSLITPMFGGDVESFKINESAPVRSQAVKGQLRFWWRAMQGYTDKAELLQAETEIWGGSLAGKKCQSKVKVSVANFKGLKVSPIKKERPWTEPNILASYVLFPVYNDKKLENPSLLCQADFTITITYPVKYEKDAINSLLLWTLFGGVGARTRRGCGSVYSEKFLKERNVASIDSVVDLVKSIGAGSVECLEYARMKGAKLFYSPANGSVKEFLQAYGKFRQDRKDLDSKHPGRSYWPEPDSIRIMLGKNAPNHKPEHPDVDKDKKKVWFPRAAFGLPIMTHFSQQFNGFGDPSEKSISLEPVGAERWPSPYFIKQIKLGTNVYNIMLVMNQSFPKGLVLDGRPVPAGGLPSDSRGKIMNTKHPLDGRSIERALADALGLKEA